MADQTLQSRPADGNPAVTQAELLISGLLRYGVLLSVGLILLGSALTFTHHPSYLSSQSTLQELTHPGTLPHQLVDVMDGLRNVRGQAVVLVGLMVLVALPVSRVAFSLFFFTRQKDRPFILLTAVVLGLLLVSFVLGKTEG